MTAHATPSPPTAARGSARGFVRDVGRALRTRCGVVESDRLVVAVSGGADSVALLSALADLAPRRAWRLELTVAHVQHHLRDGADAQGESAAEQDAAFVERLAAGFGLRFLRADLDLHGTRGNVEAEARRQRYAALLRMASAAAAQHVATAHHGDDQLETVLMRLLRGASVKGLGGMPWRRRLAPSTPVMLVRPMLAVNRERALLFLQNIDQQWREDRTNADTSRLRARLRHDVLPVLHAIDPAADRRAVRAGDHLRRVSGLLDGLTDEAAHRVVRCSEPVRLSRAEARRLPRVVLESLLRRLLICEGAGADRLGHRVLGQLAAAVGDEKGGRRCFSINRGICAVVTRDEVSLERDP